VLSYELMFDTVNAAVDAAREAARVADPDALDGEGAMRLLEAGTAIKRAGETLELLAARRLQQTNAGRREGDRTHAHYLARKTGTTRREAEATLRTARHLDPLSVTADALRAGELSTQQAEAITDAVAADPHAETRLLEVAHRSGVNGLRNECRRVKAAALVDAIARDDEIRRTRFLRTWTDGAGAGRGEWKLPPEDHARVVARVTAELQSVLASAKTPGAPREAAEANAADALVRMAEAEGSEGGTRVEMHLRVDQAAFERGTTAPGEVCEIEGIGPIPVATARNLSTRAVVNALLVDGTDISRYVNLGRYIPSALERSLIERDQTCTELGCDVTDDLEIHHIIDVDSDGPTSLENCCRLCKWHHYLCTHKGWRVEGESGNRHLVPPTARAPDDRSPPDDLQLAV
jgi:hypothetical protein